MTIIQMQKHNKDLLKKYGDGSYNDIVQGLIESIGDKMLDTSPEISVSSTIRLHDDTLTLLDELKTVPSESYESVIVRLCLTKDLYSSIM